MNRIITLVAAIALALALAIVYGCDAPSERPHAPVAHPLGACASSSTPGHTWDYCERMTLLAFADGTRCLLYRGPYHALSCDWAPRATHPPTETTP